MDNYFATLLYVIFSFFWCNGQHLLLRTSDFDLNGSVKTCVVITDYGRELFEFNAEGILIKSTTLFNENNKNITHYIIEEGRLAEKRVESFSNGQLDPMNSMANFYSYDTISEYYRVVEKIISYDKDFLEVHDYKYNRNGQLMLTTISNQESVDEKRVEYEKSGAIEIVSTFNNGILHKTVETETPENGTGKTIVTTKYFVDGEPHSALKQLKSKNGNLLKSSELSYHQETRSFKETKQSTYFYSKENILLREVVKSGNGVSSKEFIFQFDDNIPKNWVKKITTPDNEYVTRKITYFPIALAGAGSE